MQSTVTIGITYMFGLMWGSFANVLIARVPDGLSIGGRSRCLHCKQQLRNTDLIPVLSWLALAGKCRSCHGPISYRYPVVEIASATLLTITARWNLSGFALAAWLVFVAFAIPLAVIDLQIMRLPDLLVFPMLLIGLSLFLVDALRNETFENFTRAINGGLFLATFFLAIRWISRGGMGLGDVKLALVTGAYLSYSGWSTFFIGTFISFLIAAVIGIFLMIVGRAGRKTRVPFGPFMLLGAWLAYWFAPPFVGII